MRILVVEDERKAAAYLAKGLSENGFEVEVAAAGDDGLRRAQSADFDLIILDVMLPRLDGWGVLSALRQAGKQTPVLFLTARDAVDDRVKGLDLGADDYLVKPFAFSELLARVRTLLRRNPARQPDLVHLTPKEFGLLSLFARRAGEVLSRSLIAEQVWDVNFDSGTNVVDVHVRRLRGKVDDPFPKKLIHTVRGAGYVLEDRP